MIDKFIDRWIRCRYYRWEVLIAEQWDRRLAARKTGSMFFGDD
jgi:hypothetical protein